MAENIAERENLILTSGLSIGMAGKCQSASATLGPAAPGRSLRLSVADPNLYFHNGPENTFGLHSQFGEKLTWMLSSDLVQV
jgi:hypothetical protein